MFTVKNALKVTGSDLHVMYSDISHIDLVNNDDKITAVVVEKSGEITRITVSDGVFVWARTEEVQIQGVTLIEKLKGLEGNKTVYDTAQLFFESLCPYGDVIKSVSFNP